MTDAFKAIEWRQNRLVLLDQRLLPQQEIYNEYEDAVAVAGAITDMVVRGAPAIGITAAYGIVLSAMRHVSGSEDWEDRVAADMATLADARPTAINLFWAIERLRKVLAQCNRDNAIARLLDEAVAIHDEDCRANHAMAEKGAALITARCSVLTHCNTGALATGCHGTALGVIRTAYEQGRIDMVYADETRPWLQGSRLTAWELVKEGIPVTLIADGAAAWLMRQKKIGWLIVGSDRIAANGDVANKIGTYSAMVNARHHGVKTMVVAPGSTIAPDTATGDDIPIELRDENELMELGDYRFAAPGARAWNPVFDVTPANLVDHLVTTDV